MERACRRFGTCPDMPLCLDESTSPELVAALRDAFPNGVLLVEEVPGPGITTTAPGLPCSAQLYLSRQARQPVDTVVGMDVWNGTEAHTYWFEWQGSAWVDITPEDAGTTDTRVIT